MRDDDSPGPSLLLAGHEKAHREHLWNQHNHNRLHHRQAADATATASASVVTEVIQTVSVVAQIDVDSNGNTFSVLTVPETSGYQAVLTDSSSMTSTTAATPSSSNPASGALSTVAGTASETNSSSLISSQSASVSQSATTALASTPLTHSSSFASLVISSNNTLIPSLSRTFANSSSSLSSSRSSLTYLISSSSSFTSSDEFLSTTSTLSSNSFTSTSFQSTSTGSAGVIAGTGVTPGTATSSVASSGNGTDSNSGSSVSTSAVVGGVVGSIAGVAVIALLLLFIVKWRKNRNGALLSLGSGRDGAGDGADAMMGGPPTQPSGGMAERRSFVYAVPAALASLTGYKRSSQSSTAGGEREFVRVSGRKLPSVLQTGGDGYGGPMPDNTLSGSSFYRDSHGFYGGPGTPTFPTMETQRESGQIGTPVMRPSPARTPVTEQGPFSAIPSPLDPLPPPRPDVLGRSHPSQDGSHASRFTEEV